MTGRRPAIVLGATRVALGAFGILAPRIALGGFGLPASREMTAMARAVGARDAAIGIAVLSAGGEAEGLQRAVLLAGAVDAVDAVAFGLAGSLRGAVAGAGSALTHAALAARLE